MFLSKNIFAARKKGQFNSATMWLSVPVYVGALLGACCRSHRRMTNNCAPNVTVLIVTILRVTFQSLKECIFTTAQKFPFFIGAENKKYDQSFQDHSVHCTHSIGYRDHIHCRLLCASHAGVHCGADRHGPLRPRLADAGYLVGCGTESAWVVHQNVLGVGGGIAGFVLGLRIGAR